MPEMDGYDATHIIKNTNSINSLTPIVGLTANVDNESKRKCYDAGMVDVQTKPIRKAVLLSFVQKWLSKPNNKSETLEDISTIENNSYNKEMLPINIEAGIEEFGDEELFIEVVNQLIENIEKQIIIMQTAISENNIEQIAKEAHSIKGGSATVEAYPLSNAAKEVESLSKSKADMIDIQLALKKMNNEFEQLKIFLK